MRKKFAIAIIPAFNEEKKIGKVVNEVSQYVHRVVVVDDGSRDRTAAAIKNRKAIIITHLMNLGQGAALQTGFEYAKEVGADLVLTYDADGQFKASDIPKMIAPILKKKAEVVFGSRFLGSTVDMPFLRLLILKIGIYFTYLFSHISLSDTHNGFRAFSKKALTILDIKHNRWSHPSDIIYQVSRNRLKVLEVPVTVTYSKYSRGKGQSNTEALKIPFELIFKALFGV